MPEEKRPQPAGESPPAASSARPGAPERTPPAPEAPSAAAEQGEAAGGAPGVSGSGASRRPGGRELRGIVVSPGLALGPAHRRGDALGRGTAERVPLDEVDRELNRFRKALDDSRLQLLDLKSRLEGKVREEDARILDTHLTYLKDSVFIADVENLILNEQMRLEAAISKVVADFDRIFRLVENDVLRQSAVDLRDVGIRVLRNLERNGPAPGSTVPGEYVLVAKELCIVDMFNLSNEHVKGIVTEEGGLTSHAAILARSMRIPTLTGVERLLDVVREGDFLIVDATEGVLRVDPDEVVRAQYAPGSQAPSEEDREAPEWSGRPATTLDGEPIEIGATCGNLNEVEQAARSGAASIGPYRTELLYLIEQKPPSRDALVKHYASVVSSAGGLGVTFRLLSVDSSLGVRFLHPEREANPALGKVGIRALLDHESVLRRQLQAFLLAAPEGEVRVAVPFVTDCGELRRVKEILFEERIELRKSGERFRESMQVGVVIETPAAMLGIRDLALEADFLLLNLDSLQQYLLATDRENANLASAFELLHPFVLRALDKACRVAQAHGRPVEAFGVTVAKPENVLLLVGVGLRSFRVGVGELRGFREALGRIDAKAAARAARVAARNACRGEMSSHVAGYRHGYAR